MADKLEMLLQGSDTTPGRKSLQARPSQYSTSSTSSTTNGSDEDDDVVEILHTIPPQGSRKEIPGDDPKRESCILPNPNDVVDLTLSDNDSCDLGGNKDNPDGGDSENHYPDEQNRNQHHSIQRQTGSSSSSELQGSQSGIANQGEGQGPQVTDLTLPTTTVDSTSVESENGGLEREDPADTSTRSSRDCKASGKRRRTRPSWLLADFSGVSSSNDDGVKAEQDLRDSVCSGSNRNNAKPKPVSMEPAKSGSRQTKAKDHHPAAESDDISDTAMVECAEPREGTRVYARWPANESWYWGTIKDVTKHESRARGQSKRSTPTVYYTVLFDDGDVRSPVPREDFVTEQTYFALGGGMVSGKPTKVRKVCEKANRRQEKQERIGENLDKKREKILKLQNPNKLLYKQGKNKPKSREQGAAVGVRCYSKFTDNSWHWGTITEIEGKGIEKTCTVEYDDGDIRHNIRVYDELMTESEYRPEYIPWRCFSDFDRSRCRNCALCNAPDCGSCSACENNSNSTTVSKECCLFRSCLKVKADVAARYIPHFPSDWIFYFTDHRPEHVDPPLHPALAGFVVVDLSNCQPRKYYCLESAGVAACLASDKIRNAEKELLGDVLGLKIRKPEDHILVGKGFCREWIQYRGQRAVIFGKIEACERDRFDGSLVFTIRYEEQSLSLIESATAYSSIPKLSEHDERVAWAGCLRYEVQALRPSDVSAELAKTTCVPVNWMVPDMVKLEMLPPDRFSNGYERPKQTILFRCTVLEFETRKSLIPNSGLGVFVRCSNFGTDNREKFQLENGEMLDFGTYAPLTRNDFRDGTLFVFKNYIFDGACEGWSFDAIGHESSRKLFDITSDTTGELHDEARANLLSYINETNGIEIPSVRADHDPEGAVHYLLGHYQVGEGPLVLPIGQWVEIKVDYGPTYEEVRVKKGYSRLSKEEREKTEQSLSNDDKDTMDDIGSWSVHDIELCISFLEKLPVDESKFIRWARKTLRISIRLFMRLTEVRDEFATLVKRPAKDCSSAPDYCDNGYSTMEEKKLIPRLRSRIQQLLALWDTDTELKNVLLREEYSIFQLVQLLNRETAVLRKMSAVNFRTELEKALGIR